MGLYIQNDLMAVLGALFFAHTITYHNSLMMVYFFGIS